MPQLLDTSLFSVIDTDSSIGVGWRLNFYIAGTSTRKNTYPTSADAEAGTNANSNPVVIDADGRLPAIWLADDANYKGILTDENDVVKQTIDQINQPHLASDLASEDGASMVSGKAPYSAAIVRALGDRVWDGISLKDFGATGAGTADDTAAVQEAIDVCVFAGGTPSSAANAGVTLEATSGIYSVDDLLITDVASTNNGGLNGLRIRGNNAVLKGRAAATKILSVATDDTAVNISGVVLEGLQFDMSAMTTAAVSTAGLYFANAYRCTLRDIHFYGGPANSTHLQFSHTGSQLALYDVHGSRFRIEGDDYGAAQLVYTTMNFYGCSWNDLLLDKAWGINFWGCVGQEPQTAALKLSNCDTINIIGGDYEGTPGRTYLDFSGGNVSNVRSEGNRNSSLTTYSTGECTNFQDLDRPGGAYAVKARTAGRKTVSTSATEIYNFGADPRTAGAAYTYSRMTVFGEDGTSGFIDEIAVAFGGVISVLSSNTSYGLPAARTYTFATPGSLRLALASGSMQVKAVALLSPYS